MTVSEARKARDAARLREIDESVRKQIDLKDGATLAEIGSRLGLTAHQVRYSARRLGIRSERRRVEFKVQGGFSKVFDPAATNVARLERGRGAVAGIASGTLAALAKVGDIDEVRAAATSVAYEMRKAARNIRDAVRELEGGRA